MEAHALPVGRRTSSTLFSVLALSTLLVLLAVAPARAADQCNPAPGISPLPFSSFQGADGDQCNATGTAGSYDWQKIVADGGFGTGGGTALIDNDTATGLNVFKGGSKEQEPKDWGFTSDFPNKKTNILAAWGYPDAQPNHLFLYLAFAREEASGSVNYNFELNQNAPSETFTTSQGDTAIKRRRDDILIAYDRTGNSSVEIRLCRWLPSSADPALAHLDGTWTGCTELTATGQAQAATNLNFPVTNFLAGGTLGAGQFGEAAIDLTSALNLGGPGQAPCADFGAFWVRSRQSGSITSDPSDFIAPAKVGVNNCGRVIVKKTTVGTATVPPTKFGFSANFNAIAEGSPDTTPNAFELAGGDTESVIKVQPGPYALTEADATAQGYDLTDLTCVETGAVTNTATTTSLATRTATLNVDSGEEITCTYTNTRRGQIIVEKQTHPDGDTTPFAFTTSAPGGGFSLIDGATESRAVAPGTYTATEAAQAGWELSDLVCDDANSTVDEDTGVATFRVEAGETVKCTFTNTKDGRLVVEKQTLPNGDSASFAFTTSAPGGGSFSLTDGATEGRDVQPGTYTATESAQAGWELTDLVCDDANSTVDEDTGVATFVIGAGETVTCTFTNTKDGRLVVEKQTLPDGDAASFAFTTSAPGGGFSLIDGATEGRDVQPGTYTATESAQAGWELTGLVCDDANSTVDEDTGVATFVIGAGETVTCTFTNTKDGRLVVEKQTLPNGDAASFAFTTSAPGGGFSLIDGATEGRDVQPGTYTVTESAKAGWELTDLVCDDANSAVDEDTGVATFVIAAGETVTCTFTNTKDGRLVVEKQTLPDGDAASFAFTISAPGSGFSLTDGATEGRDVKPGIYTTTEIANGGWELTGLVCDDANSTVDIASGVATFRVEAGETVRCTYTNTKDGRLVVEKQTLPNGDSASFAFTTSAPGGGFSLIDGATEGRDVKPGTYTVTESAKAGWHLTDLVCDDTNSTVDEDTGVATFDVSPGETVRCTFTNTKDGRLVVEKQTLPDGDAASFAFTTSAPGGGNFSLTDGATEGRDVAPGTYTATEAAKSGWELTDLVCDDANSTVDEDTGVATFHIAPGETVKCTFTNSKDGRLVVEKQTLPNGDSASFAFTTSAPGGGSFSLTDGATEGRDVKPGTYTATEAAKSGWELTDLVCDDANSTVDTATGVATFHIAPGETVKCTFTNTKDGRLVVEKQTLPNGDAASFAFTTSAPGGGSFSLTDGATEGRDVAPGTYTATESAKSGWELTDLVCDDANSTVDEDTGVATFRVGAGETVKCTFTNTKDGRLVVEKQTLPNGDSASFAFTTSAPGGGNFSLTDGATEGRDVKPGTYTATESAKAGWELTGLVCDDANSTVDEDTGVATFVIAAGETVKCTFTNTKDGRLVVEKQTLPDGDAASFAFTTSAPGGGFSLTDGATEGRDVAPGTYTATEAAKAGWELTDLVCDDANSTVDTATGVATFRVEAGETVRCTYTNTKDGRLVVEKQTLPNGDAASFAFTTSAPGGGNFSLTDGATEGRDVKPGTYTATEAAKAGWDLTDLVCDDANSTVDEDTGVATFRVGAGETVTCTFTNTKDGRLVVEKQTLPNGDAASFAFTTSAPGGGNFSLTDGATEGRDVAPGTYTATEAAKAGWELTDLVCSDLNSDADKSTATATFDVSPGETVTCTFTNTKDGELVVEKQTLPDGDGASFAFTTSAPGGSFSLGDGGLEGRSVKPGTYTVTESAKAGWDLTGLVCDDADSATDRANATATFRVAPGETVLCTFTNTKDARLIVKKQTLPDGDAASFAFTTSAPGGNFSLSDDGTEGRDVRPGTYTVTENATAGWELTDLVCSDTDSAADEATATATFDIAPGEHVTCTFTNTKDGKLVVEKQTLPDGDATSFDFTTTATGAGTFSLADGDEEERDVKPGTYTATEAAAAGYSLTALTCDDTDSDADEANRKATFHVAPGETVTCTFTNSKDGKLVVEKQTLPDGDATSFDFTTTATGANTFTLADGGTEERDVVPGSYTATESAVAGWELTDLDCSDANSTTDEATRKATFDVSPGETVTCTFTNTKSGRLIVEKQTLPDGDAATFGFTTSAAGGATFSLADGATEERDVAPGTYTATETAAAGWELTDLVCSDANSATDKPNRTATFDISPGETVTCTFTNTKDGKLVVEKQTLPDGDSTEFDFTTSAGAPSFRLRDGASEQRVVKPGTYTATEAAASGYRLDSVSCDDADSTGDRPARTATFAVAPGETVTCTFVNRMITANAVVVKAGNAYAYHGDQLTFTFTVNNSGQSPLTNVQVSDDKCSPVTLQEKRDINGNPDATPDVLDLTDTWIYTCTMAVPAHADGEQNPSVNTVTVAAIDEFNRPVSDTDQHATRILHPAIAIDKTGPATAQAGQPVLYTLAVTNPGDVPFLAARVSVTDALCDAPPLLTSTNGDASPGQLDPGDKWTYTCTVQTQVGQTQVDNVGVVTAQDSFGGHVVTDDDPATTALTQPAVQPPAAIEPQGKVVQPAPKPVLAVLPAATGTAKLRGPSKCVNRKFTANVTGKGIAKVTFLLDGKVLKTVKATAGRTVFSVRINPAGQDRSAHRVTAKITFKASANTSARTLRLVYVGCPRSALKPQFTG